MNAEPTEPVLLTDEAVMAEIAYLRDREWDLLDQVHAARHRRAELMTGLRLRTEGAESIGAFVLGSGEGEL